MIFVDVTEGKLRFNNGRPGDYTIFAREDRPNLVTALRNLIDAGWDGHMQTSASLDFPQEYGWYDEPTPREFIRKCVFEAATPLFSKPEALEDSLGEISTLRTERDALARELAELEHECGQKLAEIEREHAQKLDEIEREHVQVCTALVALRDERDALQAQISLRSDLDALRAQVALRDEVDEREESQPVQVENEQDTPPPVHAPVVVQAPGEPEIYPDGSKIETEIEPVAPKPRKRRGG